MTAELEIIGAPQSVYVRAVRMACVEKGVAHRVTPAWPHSPEIEAIHPYGRIPGLRHGPVELFESRAIAAYVDAAFEGPRLIPADPVAGARAEQWVSVVHGYMLPTMTAYSRNNVFPSGADGRPDRAAIDALVPALAQHIALLDRTVARTGYLAGEGFTLADIAILPMLAYLRMFPKSGPMLEEAASLSAYFATHARRPCFVATEPPPMGEPAAGRRRGA